MKNKLPLPTLLSHALVAFTIEFDNESEHQLPHRTTNHGSTPGALHAPWLVSLAMWDNCMRFVGKHGVRVGDLELLARTKTNLNGMERWGYVVVEPDPADTRPKPPLRDWLISATPAGRKAQEIWGPLFSTIEKRWEARFGWDKVDELRESLWAVARQIEVELPDCLPILGYGLFSGGPDQKRRAPSVRKEQAASPPHLSALLSRTLLAFAIEFERESDLSLAICANFLRILNEEGVRIRELPRLSGVSKELIKVSLGFLNRNRYIAIAPDPATKGAKLVQLTTKGRKAQDDYRQRLDVIEERWQARFGEGTIHKLRGSLESVVGDASQRSPLFHELDPYPEGWRASVRPPDTLPHYPMITHRGGFPDGS